MYYNFSDYFKVSKNVMRDQGVYDISIISDTPVFIDPFLLFVSKNHKYQNAHEGIMKYLLFLCKKIKTDESDISLKKKYFYFKEPKQNWFGFSEFGNSGRGLNKDFADKFYKNLKEHVDFIENEKFSHVEELIIFEEGFGKDSVSDFTTKLILPFLLSFTEQFAKKYVDSSFCKNVIVKKAYFDFDKECWCDKAYYLPIYKDDYVILTPTDIIVENDDFICREDLLRFINYSSVRIPDSRLRDHVNEYLSKMLDDRLSKEQKKKLTNDLLNENPEIIRYYSLEKERESDKAIIENEKFVEKIDEILDSNIHRVIQFFEDETRFYDCIGESRDEIIYRLNILDSCLQRFGDDLFYHNDKFIGKKYANVIINRLWKGNNQNQGNVEFRFTYNSPIEKTIKGFNSKKNILCYISMTEKDIDRFNKVMNKVDIKEAVIKHIILIKEDLDEK
ncbi:MAG: hypothetical protein SPG60_03660 [Eubacterium coprostanoligenes]|nr:hypothetical protein [Eubacterium coprostanoligenes]